MMEYDDSAFYYFSISVMTFMLVPYTFWLLRKVYKGAYKIEKETANC